MWFKQLMQKHADRTDVDQIAPDLIPFIMDNLELEGYNGLYILMSSATNTPASEQEAKRVITNAIISSLEHPAFLGLKQEIIIDSSRGEIPFISVDMDGAQLKLQYNGMSQGAGHALEQSIQSQGYTYSNIPGAQRGRQRARALQPNQPNQMVRMEGSSGEDYARYANHLGYLIGHTNILVDHPQLSERVDQDNPRRRMTGQDKYSSSFEAFIRLNKNFGPDALFSEVLDESGGRPFAAFKGHARIKGNSLAITRYEFVAALVEYTGLDTVVHVRPLPAGSEPEKYKLSDHSDQVLQMLLRHKPEELSGGELEQWYQYGLAGEII